MSSGVLCARMQDGRGLASTRCCFRRPTREPKMREATERRVSLPTHQSVQSQTYGTRVSRRSMRLNREQGYWRVAKHDAWCTSSHKATVELLQIVGDPTFEGLRDRASDERD